MDMMSSCEEGVGVWPLAGMTAHIQLRFISSGGRCTGGRLHPRGPPQLWVQHSGILELNAPGISPGVRPPGTFLRLPSHCHPLRALQVMRHGAPQRAGRRKKETMGTVARERGCPWAVAALHPNTNPREGLLAIKVGSHLSDTGDFYLFSCLSCV